MEHLDVSVPLAADELAPGSRLGDYIVLSKLGAGGTATVYAATHPAIGSRVAIKVMHRDFAEHPDIAERFLREARVVNQIGHANIVDIFSWGCLPDGRRYYVMEWLGGESLSHHIDNDTLCFFDKLEILLQLADAVEAAHASGVIHRDIKSDNIMVVPVGARQHVKLVDFGLAQLTDPGERLTRITQRFAAVGTPEYLSPEQARGRNVDHRTDIYALGVVAYELVLGQLPFVAESGADIIRMQLFEQPVPPLDLCPSLPPELASMIERMLEKPQQLRPTLSELKVVLLRLIRGARNMTLPEPRVLRPSPPPTSAWSEERPTMPAIQLMAVGTDPGLSRVLETLEAEESALAADDDGPEIEVVIEVVAEPADGVVSGEIELPPGGPRW